MAKIEMTETLKSILEDAVKMYAEDPVKVEYIQSILAESGTAADLTDKNKSILKWMQDNAPKYLNTFSAKQIGDGLFVSGRSVSGSIRKLITLGLVEKQGKDPVFYSLTKTGKQKELD